MSAPQPVADEFRKGTISHFSYRTRKFESRLLLHLSIYVFIKTAFREISK
jgi:hypothetical protein